MIARFDMMNQPTSQKRSVATSNIGGRILSEVLVLLFTIVLSGLLVALLLFAPRWFVSANAGTGSQRIWGYLSSVSAFFIDLMHGQLADKSHNAATWRDLGKAAQHTIALLGISMAIALPLGIGWGALLVSVRRPFARALLFGFNSLVMALPAFALILLSMEAVANITYRTGYRLTFVQGYGIDRHLILPAGVLVLRSAAYLARGLHIALEDLLQQDWIRAARARGLGGFTLWRRHVLPALRLPLLGIALGMLRVMAGAIIIVDYIYAWGGLGRLMLNFRPFEIAEADVPLSLSAALVLVLAFVLLDALGQIALRYADPRLRELGE